MFRKKRPALVLATPASICSMEPLEDRLLFALAKSAGGSGYSGTLSTNTAIRKQQLISDPDEPIEGSTSVQYNPSLVHLSGAVPGPGYNNSSFKAVVEVSVKTLCWSRQRGWYYTYNNKLQPITSFLDCPWGKETGYAQVFYKLTGTAGQIAPPSGYNIQDEGGVTGVDTHAFFFDIKTGVHTNAIVDYQIFAATQNTYSNNAQDYLKTADGTILGPNDLTPAFVSTQTAPTITSVGGPYSIAEGSGVTLAATATDVETPGALTYAWDLNNDDVTDATSANPTLTPAALAALGLGDGPGLTTVRLTVSDGQKSVSSDTTLTITNVKPSAGIAATPGSVVAPAGVSLSATDASAADTAAGFAYLVDWGDGTPTELIPATPGNGAGINATHQYALGGTYTVTAVASDKDGGTSDVATTSVVVVNNAPTVTSNGGPYTIAEGAGITLSASATDDETPGTLSYAWDLNNDNIVDATGPNPTLSAASLATLGLDDGPASKTVTLKVGDGQNVVTSTTTLTVDNVAPTAGATATTGTISVPVVLSLSSTDPSLADRAAGFRYLIDWGDGSGTQTILPTANNGSGLTVSHAYGCVGPFTISVTAIDKDGGASSPVTVETGVSGASLCPDPSNPSVKALCVYGTPGNDRINFSLSRSSTVVYMNGDCLGTFRGFNRIIARSIGGDDCITMDYCASTPIVFFGGDGKDRLIAGNTNGVMVGGDGDDYLDAGNGKDLLIGGLGADSLYGGNADDVLVAGRTSFDAGTDEDVRSVTKLLNEWMGSQSYETKIARMTGTATGGLNGTTLLKPGVTVFDDGVVDRLYGGKGRDWFILNRTGGGVIDITDLAGSETGTDL